jgi:plastocyanin
MKRTIAIIALSVFFLPALAQASQFRDVAPDAWFARYIDEAVAANVVSGYRDAYGRLTGYFGPENRVTVAEALKIALESAGYDVSRGVGYGHWAAKYFSVAMGEHFVLVQDPSLNPDRPATRAEVASLMSDAFRIPVPVTQSGQFKDVDSGVPFAAQIEALATAKVVGGDTDAAGNAVGTFRPLSFVNRAETVKIAMAARTLYGEPGNRPVTSSSFSSTGTSSSSSTGTCQLRDCGVAPGVPNWQCQDGSIGGPSCERLPDSRCGWIIKQCKSSSSSSSSSKRSPLTFDVQYTRGGFVPSLVSVRLGDIIRFKNTSGYLMWVASNPYPSHSDYPDFDERASVGTGATFSFTFNKVGVWGYHNYMKPEHQAVVVVDQ